MNSSLLQGLFCTTQCTQCTYRYPSVKHCRTFFFFPSLRSHDNHTCRNIHKHVSYLEQCMFLALPLQHFHNSSFFLGGTTEQKHRSGTIRSRDLCHDFCLTLRKSSTFLGNTSIHFFGESWTDKGQDNRQAIFPYFQSLCWAKLAGFFRIKHIDTKVVSIFTSNSWQESG